MMATAIGPQNTLRDSGTIAKMAVPAVSRIGRARRTVAGGAMLVASVTMVIFTGIGNNVLAVAVLGFASFCEDLVMASDLLP